FPAAASGSSWPTTSSGSSPAASAATSAAAAWCRGSRPAWSRRSSHGERGERERRRHAGSSDGAVPELWGGADGGVLPGVRAGTWAGADQLADAAGVAGREVPRSGSGAAAHAAGNGAAAGDDDP